VAGRLHRPRHPGLRGAARGRRARRAGRPRALADQHGPARGLARGRSRPARPGRGQRASDRIRRAAPAAAVAAQGDMRRGELPQAHAGDGRRDPGGKNIDPERAGFHAAAYTVCNDITARGYHRRDAVPADAFRYDWFAAKSVEGSLPLGPGLTPSFLVPDPQDLRLRLWVNGELQQDESTADMVCPVAELIAAASEVVTLEPGDVIATGTPAGVGAARGLYLRGGDVVRVTIDGLGTLENTVKED